MRYVCSELGEPNVANGIQDCLVWAEAGGLEAFKISWEQAQDLALAFSLCCAVIFAYHLIKKVI